MSLVGLADFRKVAKASLDLDVAKHRTEQELEINQRLLGKFLIENFDRFRRCVTQSEETLQFMSGMGRYYHVFSELGSISGRRLFFEIINADRDAVNIHEEKRGTKTSPPTEVYRNLTNALCGEIVDYLIS
ncbi:MAG: hypothetical protein HZA94_01275 [Candidatus Vogelbacteria bacterium]|nr:hypothetical protein [Candidatus Vogelbacteria bacterium]